MLPLRELFVEVYVRIADAIAMDTLPIPRRPGPAPACTDAEVLTLAVVRHLRACPSERAWLAEVRREWGHYFPHVPHRSEFNRRVRWLRGAFELLRQQAAATLPLDPWQQIDTTAVPVKHVSRHRRPDSWVGPEGLTAGLGRDAAHKEWFYGFRLALRTDLGSRVVRAWSLVPAAVDERAAADDLLEGFHGGGLLLDRGFLSAPWAAKYAARGVQVVVAHGHAQRRRLPRTVRRAVAALRNRIETSIGEITDVDRLRLVRHGARTFCGLMTRTAATLLAHTWLRLAWV